MGHVIEPAASGRAKCRGCGKAIAKDELRFGERQPNAFGDGEMTLWLHLTCAAYKRPEPLLETLGEEAYVDLDSRNELERIAETSAAHRRLPRIDGASRAPTSRARCRACKELIEKDAWRIDLVFFEGYRFQPSGYVHVECAGDYFETTDVLGAIAWFSPKLEGSDLKEIEALLSAARDD